MVRPVTPTTIIDIDIIFVVKVPLVIGSSIMRNLLMLSMLASKNTNIGRVASRLVTNATGPMLMAINPKKIAM